MWVAGVDVPAGSVARLAAILERSGEHALAQRVGIAVDANQNELALSADNKAVILEVLADPPDALAPLREALLQDRPHRRWRLLLPRVGGGPPSGLG